MLRQLDVDLVRVSRLNSVERRRVDALTNGQVDVLLDVGANVGSYARIARKDGYRGRIVSFEPGDEAFSALEQASARDPLWECRKLALGNDDGDAKLNISRNTVSSSLLPIAPATVAAAPEAAYVGVEVVMLARLDTLANELLEGNERLFLKLDVQGLELEVVRGSSTTLSRVSAIEAEMSVQPVYEGQPLLTAVVAHLDRAGFDLVAMEPAFRDCRSGKLLQLDSFFIRRN
jgi:FkbM family methyltransferase